VVTGGIKNTSLLNCVLMALGDECAYAAGSSDRNLVDVCRSFTLQSQNTVKTSCIEVMQMTNPARDRSDISSQL
jgi:hypothetical protein